MYQVFCVDLQPIKLQTYMWKFLNKTFTMGLVWLVSASPLLANSSPNPDKEKRKQDILRLIELKNNPDRNPVFRLLKDGNKCFDFCMQAYSMPEADYQRTTKNIEDAYEQNAWMREMCGSLTPKEVKKYKLGDIGMLLTLLDEEEHLTRPRYEAVTKFCNSIFTMRHKAEVSNMPKGKINYFLYTEYGSSRPDPVYYEVKRDSATGKPILYGPEWGRIKREVGRLRVELDEAVLDTLRQQIEAEKLYQALGFYSRPHIPDVPEITGGPPSWDFKCELEGGSISSGGAQFSPPSGCIKISYYLEQFLEAEFKRRIEEKY